MGLSARHPALVVDHSTMGKADCTGRSHWSYRMGRNQGHSGYERLAVWENPSRP
jgi:hypothetical protein